MLVKCNVAECQKMMIKSYAFILLGLFAISTLSLWCISKRSVCSKDKTLDSHFDVDRPSLYSPEYRLSTKCFDCIKPSKRNEEVAQGNPKLFAGM